MTRAVKAVFVVTGATALWYGLYLVDNGWLYVGLGLLVVLLVMSDGDDAQR